MNNRTTDYLVIGGVKMPPLKSLEITKEKVWSSNTGRVASGLLVGDMVAIKYKLVCTFVCLDENDVKKVDAAVSPAFFNVKFRDPGSNTDVTKRMYAGTPTYPIYSYSNGRITYEGVAVDLIEQ